MLQPASLLIEMFHWTDSTYLFPDTVHDSQIQPYLQKLNIAMGHNLSLNCIYFYCPFVLFLAGHNHSNFVVLITFHRLPVQSD